ncbi:MAG: hypothetical protein ACOYJC_00455 [Christensenellales bacterium]|jgi:hypothetical protein
MRQDTQKQSSRLALLKARAQAPQVHEEEVIEYTFLAISVTRDMLAPAGGCYYNGIKSMSAGMSGVKGVYT